LRMRAEHLEEVRVTSPPVARCGSPRPSTLKVQSPNSTN
jgi:hypothetical protein